MSTIIISEFMDQAVVDQLAAQYDVHYDPELVDQRSILLEKTQSAQALIVRNRTQVNTELLDACPELKVVGRLGVGLDNIDLAACKQRGIEVIPAIGANTIAVAEYVLAGMLILLRGAYHSKHAMLAGKWPRQQLQGRELYQKQLGLVGFGAIAQAVASRAQAFGMSIAAFDPFLPEDHIAWHNATCHTELEGLLASSDVISLHIPLTRQTRYIIDDEALAIMPKSAVLINTARGGVVDEAALIAALRSGEIAGAMLDVFEQEPLTFDSGFADLPNLIITPHIAGVTVESNVRVSALIAERVAAVLERVE